MPHSPATVPQALTSESYIWSFPGSPVRIYLHLKAAERLLADVTQASGATPGRETGGVLLGRAESPLKIEIMDFEAIVLEDQASEKFTLAEPDWEKIDEVKAATPAHSDGLQVVGYYRSHLRDDLSLDENDLNLFRSRFPQATDVCLLIKPLADGSTTAGFFFWDNGAIESGFSFNEFPFDPERLRLEAMEQSLAALQPKTRPAEVSPAPASDPPAPSARPPTPCTRPRSAPAAPLRCAKSRCRCKRADARR